MKKLVEINKPALWSPIRSNETSIRHYALGYPHIQKGIVLTSGTQSSPVVRYARNYSKFKIDFSLCIFTYEKDVKKIELFFESIVKKLTKSEISSALMTASSSNFKYIDTLYEGDE